VISYPPGTFGPNLLSRMYRAFDLARELSFDHPDTIAARIISAASTGTTSIEELAAAGAPPLRELLQSQPKRRLIS